MIQEIVDHHIEARARASDIHQLLHLWAQSQLNGRAPYALFRPEGNRELSEDLFVMMPVEDNDYIYAFCGRNVVAYRGFDYTGMRISDTRPLKLAVDARALYLRVLDEGKPVYFLQRTDQDQQVVRWERLALPCLDDEGRDLIVVCNKPLEYRVDLLNATIEASPDGMVLAELVRDSDGQITDALVQLVNERFSLMSGLMTEHMIGQGIRHLFSDYTDDAFWEKCVTMMGRQKVEEVEHSIQIDEKTVWLRIRISPVGERVVLAFSWITKQKMLEEERIRHHQALEAANAALAQEIARRKALEEELRCSASLDPLTGLANRRSMSEAMSKAMTQAERFGHGLSLIAIDLDHFKSINSRYGHGGGDEVLKTVARLFTYGLREDIDQVGRMGGEEFLALLPNTSLEGAVTITERLRRQFEGCAVPYQKDMIRFTASFGVCEWNGRESMDDVIRRADAALMHAKKAGRNIVVADTGEEKRITLRRVNGETTAETLPYVPDVDLAPDETPATPLPAPKTKKIRLKAPKKSRQPKA